MSGERWHEALADAERARAAAGEFEAAAGEVPSLFSDVAGRFDATVWSGASARLAEERVRALRERLQRAAAELDGVAWSLRLRAARLEDAVEQLRIQAALAPGGTLGAAPFGFPPGS